MATHAMNFSCDGSELNFRVHYGDFDPARTGNPFSTAGQFPGCTPPRIRDPELGRTDMPLRYTFWLSRENYSDFAKLVVATRQELERIDLANHGLYS